MTWFGSEPTDGSNRELEEMTSLGNSDMVNIPRDSSAMNIVNDPTTINEFGLQGAPIPPPKSPLRRAMPRMDNRLGDCLLYTSPSPRDQRGSGEAAGG